MTETHRIYIDDGEHQVAYCDCEEASWEKVIKAKTREEVVNTTLRFYVGNEPFEIDPDHVFLIQ